LIGVVPDDWSVGTLGECYEVRSGPSGDVLKTADFVRDGIPVVRAANIGDGIVQDAAITVTAETAERLSRYRLSPGDVVLVRIGRQHGSRRCRMSTPVGCSVVPASDYASVRGTGVPNRATSRVTSRIPLSRAGFPTRRVTGVVRPCVRRL
jgi:hypothetical protein